MATAKSTYSWAAMLNGVLSESSRVVSDHSRHFLALSVLFLLPLSSLLISSPSLLPLFLDPPISTHRRSLLRTPHQSFSLDLSGALKLASVASLLLVLLAAAAAAVTRSVNHGFYGRPVRLLTNLRSIHTPVLLLLVTLLSSLIAFSVIVTLLTSLCLLLLFVLSLLDVEPGSKAAHHVAIVISSITVARLQLEWCLAGVVAVLESRWGFAPLKRSGELIEGMCPAVICLWVFFVAGIGLTLWGFGLWDFTACGGNWHQAAPVIAKTVFGSALIAVLFLYLLVSHATLYLYCKAVHGELPGEIVEEFASEYVTLPFDENRVPHVVSVILR